MKKARAVIREASLKDLPALVDLENRGFTRDNFSVSQFKYLLTRGRATILILEFGKRQAGAAIMLWRKNVSVGRLYNIVIDPRYQGHGLGGKLLAACENEAISHNCHILSLEVRADNIGGIAFYGKHGYAVSEELPDYYADGSGGLRMVKSLRLTGSKPLKLKIPYYGQSLEFSCGSACLMMAFKYFTPELKFSRILELTLWREATLIYMTSGLGGTGPFGMALAAQRRGYPVRVVLSARQTPFFSSVKTPDKKRIIRLVHDDLKLKALELGVKADYFDFSIEDIAAEMNHGNLAIVLISTYHLHGDRAPHWVIVTGFDSEYIYFHDPYEKFYGDNKHLARNVRIPILEFKKMRRYGRDLYKSVIFIDKPSLQPKVAMDGGDL